MGAVPKPVTVKSDKYLTFVHYHLCCVCIVFGREIPSGPPHHVNHQGSGGSDYLAIPICARHHTEVHARGRDTFQSEHEINFAEIHRDLLLEWMELQGWI